MRMRALIGVVTMIAVIIFGVYLATWELFIGGIVSIVEAIKAAPVDGYGIGCGLFKVVIAAPVGWLAVLSGIYICAFIVGKEKQ